MTPTQIDVLQRLIAADRRYHSLRRAGQFVPPEDRGIEVSTFSISKRSARALEDAGLAETDTSASGVLLLFLGKACPFDYPDE